MNYIKQSAAKSQLLRRGVPKLRGPDSHGLHGGNVAPLFRLSVL